MLGVGYEATDADVRAAFGELTKRYHPDRFARYESTELRQIAAEIFILIRDAYRRLGDDASRAPGAARRSAGPHAAAAARVGRRHRGVPSRPPRVRDCPDRDAAAAVAEAGARSRRAARSSRSRRRTEPDEPGPHDAPTDPSRQSAPSAATELARPGEPLAIRRRTPSQPHARPGAGTPRGDDADAGEPVDADPRSTPRRAAAAEPAAAVRRAVDASALEELIDEGKLDEALAGYKVLAKKHPQDRASAPASSCARACARSRRAIGSRPRSGSSPRSRSIRRTSAPRASSPTCAARRPTSARACCRRLMGKKEP